LISIEGESENQLEPGQNYAPVLSHCSLLRNPLTKPTCAGALSWRRNQLLVFHFGGRFLQTASLGRWRMSMYISLFTVAIPVHFTDDFREPFEATTYS